MDAVNPFNNSSRRHVKVHRAVPVVDELGIITVLCGLVGYSAALELEPSVLVVVVMVTLHPVQYLIPGTGIIQRLIKFVAEICNRRLSKKCLLKLVTANWQV